MPRPDISRLADVLRQRDVSRVVYFHCDHWEPWKTVPGHTRVSSLPITADRIGQFVDDMNALPYARRMTLFYRPGVYTTLDTGKQQGLKAAADDAIVFLSRDEATITHARNAMRDLLDRSEHAIEVHIHHEGYTYNTAPVYPATGAYLESARGRAHEEQRFDLGVRLVLDAIRDETGLAKPHWFFVHGHWALQASDPTVCHIVRELQILAAHGCKGDFTFPAGRGAVNPRLNVPYFVTPIAAAKGYDQPEGNPERAYGNSAAAASKFFIWSSLIKHRGSSLDHYAPWVQERLEKPASAVEEMLRDSYAIDGTLYLKTHAHSMHPAYFEQSAPAVFPLAQPAAQRLFETLMEAAAMADVAFEFLTAGEVYDRFIHAKPQPKAGFALQISGPASDLSGIVPPPPNLK